jgi:hypothetical protein
MSNSRLRLTQILPKSVIGRGSYENSTNLDVMDTTGIDRVKTPIVNSADETPAVELPGHWLKKEM